MCVMGFAVQSLPVYLYSVVMTFDRREPHNWESVVHDFVERVEVATAIVPH